MEADERETLLDLLDAEPELLATRPGQTLIGDENYFGRDFSTSWPSMASGCCGRPARVNRSGSEPSCSNGVVTSLDAWVPDGASGVVGFRACAQGVVGRPATPVTWSQIAKRTVISAR
nr:hypothetical protein [Streptomyces torulosus]